MTSLVVFYPLKEVGRGVFCHLHCVSCAAALKGHHETGRYHLSNAREGIAFEQLRTEELLHRAQPLVEISKSARACGSQCGGVPAAGQADDLPFHPQLYVRRARLCYLARGIAPGSHCSGPAEIAP